MKRGKYIILGEVNIVVTALRRNLRWATHSYQNDNEDPLIGSFNSLKNVLNRCEGLSVLEPNIYLTPFLEVVRSEDTTGPITGLALSSINKFLCYGLIDPDAPNAAVAVSGMADAVTHARFVGTDPANDEVVLMKILQVLRVLLLTKVGTLLTNEAVCEIMQSCFRICFEMRLSELLRKSAEHTLVDMVQLLFTRLPEFKEDSKNLLSNSMKKLKMRAGGMPEAARGKRPRRNNKAHKKDRKGSQTLPGLSPGNPPETPTIEETVTIQVENDEKPKKYSYVCFHLQSVVADVKIEKVEILEDCKEKDDVTDTEATNGDADEPTQLPDSLVEDVDGQSQVSESSSVDNALNPVSGVASVHLYTYTCTVHSMKTCPQKIVRFPSSPRPIGFTGPLLPYGLACIRELFRFLISLTNPHDRHNTDVMIHMGMSLMMVALETSRVKLVVHITNPLCQLSKGVKNNYKSYVLFSVPKVINKFLLIMVSVKKFTLLYTFLPILLSNFLSHNSPNNMIILFIQNAFPVSGLYTTHLLSLDALLTVVHSIEQRCSQNESKNLGRIPWIELVFFVCRNNITERMLNFNNSQTILSISSFSATPPASPSRISKPDTEWQSATPVNNQQVAANPTPTVVPERFSGEVPTIEELQLIKQKKKILQSGTELFNQKTKKGITFLQDQNLLAVPIDVREVSLWLRANPWLDKKMIGEYISDRRHPEILDNFVRTFKFEGLRLDESLRLYLETFRLPGEAPVIQRLIEAFSAYWSECNHHPFMNLDAAFTLSYAIIMLNTDQHNRNVRKQNEPMTFHEFQRNTKGCNGGQDFDQHMLEEIYTTIRNDEIVLPDEQVGPIRDRWLWNVFLRRGASPEGTWLSTSDEYHIYDRDIFAMNWGPTVSALSYVFDKSLEENIIQRSILGFKKCALISAHFSMCNVFDNLIVSLCKFTGLTSNGEAPDMTTVIFGSNPKAQLAARTMFHLTHRHGDILREGWRNILDVILPLYRSKLLPAAMVEVEDFVDPTGRVCLLREELPMQRSDSSIFSSFYQFMTLGGPSETSNQKQTTAEDQEAMRIAQDCVKELQLETLVTESKFLRLDSLQELMKALMQASHPPHVHDAMGGNYMEDSAIFFLELLLRVVLQNRDRIMSLWQMVRDHLYSCIVMATEYSLLLERAVVGLMRMAIRLLHREEVAEEVLASLQILLMIKPSIIPMVSRQIGYGLHELLRTNAANIHARADWITIFTVMKTVGAGAVPPAIVQVPTNPNENPPDPTVAGETRLSVYSDRGYTSDSELYENHPGNTDTASECVLVDSWWLVIPPPPTPCNQFTLQLGEELRQHDMRAMVKCCETLAFLVRDAAHITPDNFELCVRCIRTFVEASINGGMVGFSHHASTELKHPDKKKFKKRKERDGKRRMTGHQQERYYGHNSDDETMVENVPGGYHTMSLQLLDLMHTLHTRAASIYSSWEAEERKVTNEPVVTAEASSLWGKCWCPLLQGIARLCCDARRQVRTSALTYLQRALLVHDLQTLTGKEWESCFNKVLFPLLTKLLENISPADPDGMEETRMRGATLLSKVFLQHLNPLLSLPTFTALWLTILDFMDKYMHIGKRDLLFEAIPESLKNMLLVMDTARIFHTNEDAHTSLWDVTWERIDCFLPSLRNEVFK
uniref:SEC7 domain-containing protein n=1 Tax=Ciona savignyi TaxID=51511 RepID=H2ZA13_CIOSA